MKCAERGAHRFFHFYLVNCMHVHLSMFTSTIVIEDVERGAEPLTYIVCIIVKFCLQTTKFWFQTDRQTDRQTVRIYILNIFDIIGAYDL